MIADTDTRDRNAVLAIARALAKLDCGIRLCLPDGEGGYGVADAIAEGGYRNMIAWIRKAGIRWFRRGPTVPAVAAYLGDLPAGQWTVDPADLYAAAGVEKRPDRHTVALIRETAVAAGWEFRRVKRKPFRDRAMFVRKGAKPKGLPRGRPFALIGTHASL